MSRRPMLYLVDTVHDFSQLYRCLELEILYQEHLAKNRKRLGTDPNLPENELLKITDFRITRITAIRESKDGQSEDFVLRLNKPLRKKSLLTREEFANERKWIEAF